MAERLALFDFDATLCRGDSIVPYLLFCIRRGLAPKRQLLKAAAAYVKQLGRPDRVVGAKAVTLSFIRGKSQGDLDEAARAFFREKLAPRFFAEGLREIKRLADEGYRVLVISASADVYMRVLPEFMPVDAVLATRCQADENGRYTGKICDNCKGENKVLRLREYLSSAGIDADLDKSCAYGDSPSDAPMLKLVGTPTLVSPHRKLVQALPGARLVHWR